MRNEDHPTSSPDDPQGVARAAMSDAAFADFLDRLGRPGWSEVAQAYRRRGLPPPGREPTGRGRRVFVCDTVECGSREVALYGTSAKCGRCGGQMREVAARSQNPASGEPKGAIGEAVAEGKGE